MSSFLPVFGKPPEDGFSPAGRIEDSACRSAMRAVGANTHALMRATSQEIQSGKLTFSQLSELAEFPYRPIVTDASCTSIIDLIYKFKTSEVWRAWVEAWECRSTPPRQRILVFRGPDTKNWVVYHLLGTQDRPAPPRRPHISLSPDGQLFLVAEHLLLWCRALNWQGGEFASSTPCQSDE